MLNSRQLFLNKVAPHAEVDEGRQQKRKIIQQSKRC